MKSAPDTITLRCCETCGLTDRFHHLRERHRPRASYQGEKLKGGLCPGPVVPVKYRKAVT